MSCLSFAGVAGNFAFEIGASQALAPLHPDAVYAGVSSGSVIATMLALGYDANAMQRHLQRFRCQFNQWWKTPYNYWLTATGVMFNELMSDPNTYLRCNDRLYIGYSALTLTGLQKRVVSRYHSNQDVIDAVLSSCHLFPFVATPFRRYRGELVCDGAFTCGLVKPKDYRTIGITTGIVYANSYYSDWLPSLCEIKARRQHVTGLHFVQRHQHYFATGRLPPGYPNPFRRLRWCWWLVNCYFFLRLFFSVRKRLRG